MDYREEKNYVEDFNEILHIRETKEFEKASKDKIGLELELAVNYSRGSYTYLKTILGKIYDYVNKNGGYIVLDNSIDAEYGFEIIMPPVDLTTLTVHLSVLNNFIRYSKGLISYNHSCGMHLTISNLVGDSQKKHEVLWWMYNSPYFNGSFNHFKVEPLQDLEEHKSMQEYYVGKYSAINYKGDLIELRAFDFRNYKNQLLDFEIVFEELLKEK